MRERASEICEFGLGVCLSLSSEFMLPYAKNYLHGRWLVV